MPYTLNKVFVREALFWGFSGLAPSFIVTSASFSFPKNGVSSCILSCLCILRCLALVEALGTGVVEAGLILKKITFQIILCNLRDLISTEILQALISEQNLPSYIHLTKVTQPIFLKKWLPLYLDSKVVYPTENCVEGHTVDYNCLLPLYLDFGG